MNTPSTIAPDEVALLSRLIRPDQDTLPPAAARAILKIDFEEVDRERMRELSRKAGQGTLTGPEKSELDSYERVGHLLDLLHSKARRSLKSRGLRA